MLLQRLSSERLEEMLKNPEMMGRIERVYKSFNDYMSKPMRKSTRRQSASCTVMGISPRLFQSTVSR